MRRSGFLHTIDAVIAGLIIIVFLTGGIFEPPKPAWDLVYAQKMGQDIVLSLQTTGLFGTLVERNDPTSLNAIISAMQPSIDYTMKLRGFPPGDIRIGNVITKSYRFSETLRRVNLSNIEFENPTSFNGEDNQDYTLLGLNKSEGDEGRIAEMFDVTFLLIDRFIDNFQEFNEVYWYDTVDAEYKVLGFFGSRFVCSFSSTNSSCQDKPGERDIYEIGPVPAPSGPQHKLVFYERNSTEYFDSALRKTEVGVRDVYFDVRTVSPEFQGFGDFDVLVISSFTPEEYETYDFALRAYLASGRSILIAQELTKEDLDTSFFKSHGIQAAPFPVITGSFRETEFTEGVLGGGVGFPTRRMFYDTSVEILLTNKTNVTLVNREGYSVDVALTSWRDTYAVEKMPFDTANGRFYFLFRDVDGGGYDFFSVAKDFPIFFEGMTEYGVGDSIQLDENGCNVITVESLVPFVFHFDESGFCSYRFEDLTNSHVFGDEVHLTAPQMIVGHVSGSARYDVQRPPFSFKLTRDGVSSDISSLPGIVEGNCAGNGVEEYPYFSETIGGRSFSFVLTNRKINGVCTPEHEFINVRVDGGRYNAQYGPLQNGGTLSLDVNGYEQTYAVSTQDDDRVLVLKNTASSIVPGVVSAPSGPADGSLVVMTKYPSKVDTAQLFRSLLLVISDRESFFTPRKSQGDVAAGLAILGRGESGVPFGGESVWWFS